MKPTLAAGRDPAATLPPGKQLPPMADRSALVSAHPQPGGHMPVRHFVLSGGKSGQR